MAIGENVGSAYVKIYADGSGMDAEIRRALHDAEPSVIDGGREHGDEYTTAFDKEVRKGYKAKFGKTQKEMFKDLNDNLTSSLVRLEFADRMFKAPAWKKLRTRLAAEGGLAGEVFGNNLEKSFRDSGALDRLADSMDNLGPELRRAQKQLLDELHTDALSMNKKFDSETLRVQKDQLAREQKAREDADRDMEAHWKRLSDGVQAMYDDAYRDHAAFNKKEKVLYAAEQKLREDRDRDLNKHFRYLSDMSDAYVEDEARRSATLRKLHKHFDLYVKDLGRVVAGEKVAGRTRRSVIAEYREMADEIRHLDGDNHDFIRTLDRQETMLRRNRPTLEATNRGIGRFADGMGRAFGKGSRNNFLNFSGSFVRGMTGLVGIVPRAIGGILKFGDGLADTFNNATKFASLGPKVAGSIAVTGKLLGTGAVAAAALGIGLGIAVAASSLLAAALSLLAGIVTALASSIAFALAGAIGAVAGLLFPLAALIGVTALAFAGLDKAAKAALKVDLKPVVSAFKGLAKVAADGVFSNVENQAKKLASVMTGLRPLIGKVGGAISRIGDYFLKAMTGPGFKMFRSQMEKFLPGAVESLGRIFGNVFGGLGGLIVALVPITNRFLGWLEKITGEFARWANSKEGREQLKEFFDKAAESAKKLGAFIGEATKFLGKLFEKGKGTGDSIFDKMTDSIERMITWLEDNPDAISEWFKDAEEAADSLGSLVSGITKLIDALDSVMSRKAVIAIISALGWAFKAAGGEIEDNVNLITGAWDKLQVAAGWVKDKVTEAWDWIKEKWGEGKQIFGEVKDAAVKAWQDMQDKAGELKDKVTEAWDKVVEKTTELKDKIVEKFNEIKDKIGEIWDSLPAMLANVFITIPLQIAAAMSSIPGIVLGALMSIPGIAAVMVGQIVTFFYELPAKIGSALGMLGTVFSTAFTALSTVIGTTLSVIPTLFSVAFSGLAGIAMGAVSSIAGAFSTMGSRIGGFLATLPGVFSRAFSGLAGVAVRSVNAIAGFFAALPAKIGGFLQGVPGTVSGVFSRLGGISSRTVGVIVGFFASLPGKISNVVSGLVSRFQGIVSRLPPKAQAAVATIITNFASLPGRAAGAISAIVGRFSGIMAKLAPIASKVIASIVGFFAALPGKVSSAVAGVAGLVAGQFNKIVSAVAGIPGRIVALFSGLGSSIANAIGSIRIPMPSIPDIPGLPPPFAEGGLVDRAQMAIIGEAGPEAVVPLNRPLSQVDPAVRELSAFAQGKKFARGGTVGTGRTVDVGGITVITPSSDARAVANEVVNKLVAVGY